MGNLEKLLSSYGITAEDLAAELEALTGHRFHRTTIYRWDTGKRGINPLLLAFLKVRYETATEASTEPADEPCASVVSDVPEEPEPAPAAPVWPFELHKTFDTYGAEQWWVELPGKAHHLGPYTTSMAAEAAAALAVIEA